MRNCTWPIGEEAHPRSRGSGHRELPDWLFGVLPFEMIFSTWDEVKTYLQHIAHDPVIDRLNRWYFFDWMGKPCVESASLIDRRKRLPRRNRDARKR